MKKHPKFNDWLLVDGVSVSGIGSEHYHLADNIETFLSEYLDGTELWHPEVSSYGEVIWTNTITNTCEQICPIRE